MALSIHAPRDGESSDVNVPQSETTPLEEANPVFKPGKSFILAFTSICIITLAAALDATSLSIALPIITDRLKGTAIQAFWSGTSFLVASAVVQPVIGGLSHGFGRKQLVLASALLFAVGSLVAALATNFTMIFIGRSIQGLGGGGILTLGEILVTDLIPLSVRGSWLAYIGSMWAIGTVVGPLMGGGFAQSSYSGWRWIFWINLPLIGVGIIAIIFYLKVDRLKGNAIAKIRRFDWFGSTVFIASSVSFLVPVTWGGVMYTWDSWHTLVPLFIGAAGLVAFGFYEHRLSAKAYDSGGKDLPGNNIHPIIRFSIFNNWTLRLLYLQTLFHGMILWSLLYYLPLYYEGVKGYTPIIAGVAVLPETLLIAPMSTAVGVGSSITGRYRYAIWIGWGITTLGFGILYLLGPDTSIPAFIFLNVPVAIGTGMSFTSMSLGIQAAGRPQDAGHSITFYSFIRVFGQSLGVAVGGVVFQNQIRKKLSEYPSLASSVEEYSKDSTAVVSLIQSMKAGNEKTQLIQAYADSIKMIWVVMAALSGAIFISTFFLKEYSLNQKLDTLQGFNHGDRGNDPEKD
ncbi:hypothetical protein MMC14_006065 [Varicellaria rhodocarpa]|nr:hypothetical protein [Varicellaria rhodocarpa]